MVRGRHSNGKIYRVCECCKRKFWFYSKGGYRKYCPQCSLLINRGGLISSCGQRKEAVIELLEIFKEKWQNE